MAADDTHCPYLNPRLTCDGLRRRKIHSSANITMKASTNPTSGDSTIGMTTFFTMTCHFTVALDARAAPTRPPMSACEDDDGKPKYHVMRFHTIAPTTAANTTTRPSLVRGASMMLPTVSATFVETSEPNKLNTAASNKAVRGVSARVDTDVAMAFAASWKPLV